MSKRASNYGDFVDGRADFWAVDFGSGFDLFFARKRTFKTPDDHVETKFNGNVVADYFVIFYHDWAVGFDSFQTVHAK